MDEAHNLFDTIANMTAVSLTDRQLKIARIQLGLYLQKFGSKLKGKNRVYVAQTVRVVDSLMQYIGCFEQKSKANETIANVDDMMAGKGMDQVNLHKLLRYLQESKLARKVHGYQIESSENEKKPTNQSQVPSTPVLTGVQAFLEAVANPASEGRFFCLKSDNGEWLLRYMLLDPSPRLQEVIQDARAVILAGGTMSPVSAIRPQCALVC